MIQSLAFPTQPSLIVHEDWGSHPGKRWMASATLSGYTYLVKPTEPVGKLADFLKRMEIKADPAGSILIGVDFPIGLPYTYAQEVRVNDFTAALPGFGQGKWERFYDVSQAVEEISLYRPFYPCRPGGTRRQHLLDKLGFPSIEIHPDLELSMRDGFGSYKLGEDHFDAEVGLFGMLQFFSG
jgi:hypothetical protein